MFKNIGSASVHDVHSDRLLVSGNGTRPFKKMAPHSVHEVRPINGTRKSFKQIWLCLTFMGSVGEMELGRVL